MVGALSCLVVCDTGTREIPGRSRQVEGLVNMWASTSFRSGLRFRSGPVLFLAGLVLTLMMIWIIRPDLVIPAASAAHPLHGGPSCLGASDRGSVAAIEDYQGGPVWDKARGTRGDVLIPGSETFCQKISSIYVIQGHGGFETGFVEGYSNCTGFTGTWFSQPVPFYWAFDADGVYVGCYLFTSVGLNGGGTDNFRGSDIDQDTYWASFVNGNQLFAGASLDFEHGFNQIAEERAKVNDLCLSKFTNMDEYHPTGNWNDFDNLTLPPGGDQDPDCHFHRISADAGEVLAPN